MKRREYLLHLIGEISSFILANNPTRMVMSLHQEEDGLHLCVIDNHPRTEEEIKLIKESLGGPTRPELVAYYGNLAGFEPLGKARLKLVGFQVKHTEVTRCDSGVKIDLWVGGERFNPTKFTIPPNSNTKKTSSS